MEVVEVNSSRKLSASLLALSSLFLGGGVYVLWIGGPKWIGLTNIIFFFPFVIFFIKKLLEKHQTLVIDELGIEDKVMNTGKIVWDDIESAYLHKSQGAYFLCLEVKNEDKYLSRLSTLMHARAMLNKKFGLTAFSIGLYGANIHPKKILDLATNMIASNNGKSIKVR